MIPVWSAFLLFSALWADGWLLGATIVFRSILKTDAIYFVFQIFSRIITDVIFLPPGRYSMSS